MTTLSNANLLDDSVANSISLKNQRLKNTARTAKNPQPLQEEEEESGFEESYDDTQNADLYDRTPAIKNTESKNEKGSEGNTILGMKPAMFYTILAVGAIVGGILVYNKFFKKGKKISSAPDLGNASTGAPISSINT